MRKGGQGARISTGNQRVGTSEDSREVRDDPGGDCVIFALEGTPFLLQDNTLILHMWKVRPRAVE